MTPKPTILYIDDEENNLSNFTQSFGSDYEIFTAKSAVEGENILNEHGGMALVITDQRMAGMKGIAFLEKVAIQFPDTIRIIVTAHTDSKEIIEAINKGQVYKYIVKPWNETELGFSIRNAVANYELNKHNEQLMEELEEKNASLAHINADLEEHVGSRTKELHNANIKLREKNDQLSMLIMNEKEMSLELSRLNQQLMDKIHELDKAVRNIKALQQLLPICSYCKKIRDDENYWEEVDMYLDKHTEYTFSHSICPACYEEHMEKEIERRKK